jgi:hypothetical protein
MTSPSQETSETRAARLSCAALQFHRSADKLVSRVRRAMGVPDAAEEEVEREFCALRATLDDFYPEFALGVSGLLTRCLGPASSVVISSLEDEPVQAYLRVADAIDTEAAATLRSLALEIAAALTSAPEG